MEIRQHACRGPQNKLKRDTRKKLNSDNLWTKLGIKTENWFNVDGIL